MPLSRPVSQSESAKPCVEKQLQYTMLLAPFQPVTRIELEADVNTDTECCLIIKNTNDKTLNVRKVTLSTNSSCTYNLRKSLNSKKILYCQIFS